MNEASSTKHDAINNTHKPLKAVSSCAGRLQGQTEEKEHKSASLLDISGNDLEAVDRRRRSKSMPLTLEATQVAKGLKKLSDTLSYRYESKRKERPRRHTFGSAASNEDRRSFHFDYQNYNLNEYDGVIDETPEYERGTSV